MRRTGELKNEARARAETFRHDLGGWVEDPTYGGLTARCAKPGCGAWVTIEPYDKVELRGSAVSDWCEIEERAVENLPIKPS